MSEELKQFQDLVIQHDDELDRLIAAIPKLQADLVAIVSQRITEMSAEERTAALATAEKLKSDLIGRVAQAEAWHKLASASLRTELSEKLQSAIAALPAAPTSAEIGAIAERIASEKLAEVKKFSEERIKIEMAESATVRGQGVSPELAFVSAFKGTYDPKRAYARGDIIAYRGGSYLFLLPAPAGTIPTRENQKEPNPIFGLLAAPGSPGSNAQAVAECGAAIAAAQQAAASAAQAAAIVSGHATITYASSVTVDMNAEGYRTVTLTGNIAFSTSNRAAARGVSIRIIGDTSDRTVTLPTNCKPMGLPSSVITLLANKTAILSLTSFGTADTDVIACYVSQL